MTSTEALLYNKEALWQRSILMIAIGVAVGSSSPILARLAQEENVPSLVIAAARLCLSALFLTPFTLNRYSAEIRQLSRRDLILAAIAGAMLALHFILIFLAFERTSILIAGVLAGSSPLWVGLLEVFVLKAKLGRMVWLGLFVAIIGGTIIGFSGNSGAGGAGGNSLLGDMLALVSALCVAVHLIVGRSLRQHTPAFLYIWLVGCFAGLTSLVALVITGTPIIGHSNEGYLWLILLTLGPQLISQTAFNYALAHVPATFISIVGQIVTVFSAVLAFLLFQEMPRSLQIVGSVIVIIGVVMALRHK